MGKLHVEIIGAKHNGLPLRPVALTQREAFVGEFYGLVRCECFVLKGRDLGVRRGGSRAFTTIASQYGTGADGST